MKISWYLGFGWLSIAALLACGVGINFSAGWLAWVLYVPFLLLSLHMSIRFRSFSTQAWRRVHSQAMQRYGKLAVAEYAAAKRENRDFDIGIPCRALAAAMFGPTKAEAFAGLLDGGRKAYYNTLVDSYPQVFVERVAAERHPLALAGVRRDIEASQLGPDILIAKAIELKHNGLEAARYLQALLLGVVR